MEWTLKVGLQVTDNKNKKIVDVATSNIILANDDWSEDYIKSAFQAVLSSYIDLVDDTNSGVIHNGIGGV